ncbi:hypothetical protein ABIC78_004292 [Novosphingobium sp. 1529]|uniref:hypothetical protein n=1 Tax=Novosphingobium sp. 1529 TaxID=3156424 RepID=UPI00145A0381
MTERDRATVAVGARTVGTDAKGAKRGGWLAKASFNSVTSSCSSAKTTIKRYCYGSHGKLSAHLTTSSTPLDMVADSKRYARSPLTS